MQPTFNRPRQPSGRARETRDRLLLAGRRAFATSGLAGTSLKRDILEPAGISVGSFYHQFNDKTELLLAILADHSERFRARLRDAQRPRPGRSLEALVREAYEIVFAEAEANSDLLCIQLRERHSGSKRVRDFLLADRERWITSLTADLARMGDASGLPPAVDGASELIVALAHGAVARFLETPEEARVEVREHLVDNLIRFSLGGMAALHRQTADRHLAHPTFPSHS